MNEMRVQPCGTWRTYRAIVDKLDDAVGILERRATDPPPDAEEPHPDPANEDSVH